MPHGYSAYLTKLGKSSRTVDDYAAVVVQFFSHIDSQQSGEELELFEIRSRHIRAFLDKKREQDNNELTTINKNLTILKNFFNFLWEDGQIPIDPAGKMKHQKTQVTSEITLNYEMLLEILPGVMHNNSYSENRKIIYILALYGFRVKDFHILKKDVIDKGDSVMIFPISHEPMELIGKQAEIFINVFNDSLFNNSPYVFTKKRKNDNTLVPIEVMGIYKHLSDIKEDFKFPMNINTNIIRHLYANYLYREKGYTFERIATILGIENYSAALLVKESERRIKNNEETLEMS